MSYLKTAGCLTALLVTAACGTSQGYYDSNDVWHPYNTSSNYGTPTPGGGPAVTQTVTETTVPAAPTTTIVEYKTPRASQDYSDYAPAYGTAQEVNFIFDRPGFYDHNGYYISFGNGPQVPDRYLPPTGMCRLWFADRDYAQQPPVRNCDRIHQQIPGNSYIIYGG